MSEESLRRSLRISGLKSKSNFSISESIQPSKRNTSVFIATDVNNQGLSVDTLGKPSKNVDLSMLSPTANPDPALGFFYRPHTITILLALLSYFLYIALIEEFSRKSCIHTGLIAVTGVFLLIGVMLFPNGPFIRPHPVLWRLFLASGIAYLLFLVFILFQNVDDARQLIKYLFDNDLGVPLPERTYCEDCSLTWNSIMDKMDGFVPAHIIGWYLKALILRDYWILWIVSIGFEFMEYLLEFQLPNFAECWWDHWIMDVLVCNAIGIWAGIKTCEYFEMRIYSWQGWSEIQGVKGKMKRTIQQFTPASWTPFHWGATRNIKNYLIALLVIVSFLLGELNCFYLKYLLWIPPNHYLNLIRLFLFLGMAAAGVRELYQYFYDSRCKKLGAQAWVGLACLFTEIMIIIKFSRNEFPNPAPTMIIYGWIILLFHVLVVYPFYQFVIVPRFLPKNS